MNIFTYNQPSQLTNKNTKTMRRETEALENFHEADFCGVCFLQTFSPPRKNWTRLLQSAMMMPSPSLLAAYKLTHLFTCFVFVFAYVSQLQTHTHLLKFRTRISWNAVSVSEKFLFGLLLRRNFTWTISEVAHNIKKNTNTAVIPRPLILPLPFILLFFFNSSWLVLSTCILSLSVRILFPFFASKRILLVSVLSDVQCHSLQPKFWMNLRPRLSSVNLTLPMLAPH